MNKDNIKHMDTQEYRQFETQLDTSTLLARIDERVEFLVKETNEIKESLKVNFVEKSEFKPIKQIVYGFVKLVLLSFGGAVIYLVIK